MKSYVQSDLFLDYAPHGQLGKRATRRALDDLFSLTSRYKTTQSFDALLNFVANFRLYAPYNAMLVHLQMTGAKYVCSPLDWMVKFRRKIKSNARPLVILQPMGPVMYVFDVTDTIPLPNAPPLPKEVLNPFEVRRGKVGSQLKRTIENAVRDGVTVVYQHGGSQSAGEMRPAHSDEPLTYQTRVRPEPKFITVPLRYELLLNRNLSREARYATLVHELAHLYCGHFGSPNPHWWRDRSYLRDLEDIREFEAESVCYLVCRRLGIDSASDEYLARYLKNNSKVPPISLDAVMVAANLIERMGCERLKPRKEAKT